MRPLGQLIDISRGRTNTLRSHLVLAHLYIDISFNVSSKLYSAQIVALPLPIYLSPRADARTEGQYMRLR